MALLKNITSGSINGIVITGSLDVSNGITGSLFGTASSAINATTSSNALTASSADDFLVRGTLTAQTIVVQTITSSTEFITGSTKFGSDLSNTHQFTGSVSVTGSLSASNIVGNLQGTSSWAVNAATASLLLGSIESAISASYAATASYLANYIPPFPFTGSAEISGSLNVIGGITGSLEGTSSFALTASYLTGYVSPFPYTGSAEITGSLTVSGSSTFVGEAGTTVFSSNANALVFTGSIFTSGSTYVSGSIIATDITSSLHGTASWAQNALTTSYAENLNVSGSITLNGNDLYANMIAFSIALGQT